MENNKLIAITLGVLGAIGLISIGIYERRRFKREVNQIKTERDEIITFIGEKL